MLEDILEIKKIGNIDVFFRKQDKKVKNQSVELEKVIKYLTNEDFEDYQSKKYKRRLINPENLRYYLDFQNNTIMIVMMMKLKILLVYVVKIHVII